MDTRDTASHGTRALPLVRLSGVGKRFANGTVALDGVDLAIGRGAFVSLLGPSGCGKSTVLRLIAGLAGVSAGRIDWTENAGDGRTGGRSDGCPGGRPEIGFVFQEPTLMPWATVFDNVHLPLKLAGIGRRDARARVEEALEQVHLSGFVRAYPRELSGGMKMRISIARALITRPSVLLMDEPFAALDEITRARLSADLLELWQAQRWTVVFVTHSVYESVYLSQRILVMTARPGRIDADIAVAAPCPRDEEYRTSPDYAERCRQVSAALRRAMERGAMEERP